LDNSILQTHSSQELIPSFAGPIQNVTVNVGREAVLECPVNFLGQYKVIQHCRSHYTVTNHLELLEY